MPTNKKPSHGSRLTLASTLSIGFFFLGIVILFLLVLYHFLHNTVTLSHLDKIIYAGSSVPLVILFLGGLVLSTPFGNRFVSSKFEVSTDEMKQVRSQRRYRSLSIAVLLMLFATVYLVYIDQKQAVYNLNITRYHSDTIEYLDVGSYPLSNLDFWAGIRSFSLPLFYKIAGYNFSTYMDQGNMNRVSHIQWYFSIICWTIFAVAVCFALKNWISRLVTFSIILMMGASVDISFWDRVLLTESLAISLFVLLMALLIIGGLLVEKAQKVPAWVQVLLIGIILMVAVLYTFIRDTDGYFLLFLAFFMIVGVCFRTIRKAALFPAYLSIALGFLVIFLLGNTSANTGERYVPPMLHVFAYRFIPQEQSRNFFLAHGMPFDNRIASLDTLTLHQLNSHLVTDPSILRLIAWLGTDGEKATMQYLVSHPGYFLFAPLSDVQPIINGQYTVYRLTGITPVPARISWLSAILYLRFAWLPLLFVVLAVVSIVLIFAKSNRPRIIWYVVLAAFLTAYPLAVIGWHGDTNDIERHSVQVAIQLRLAVWILLGLLVERGYALLRDKFNERAEKKGNIAQAL
jgi:hypothetical protein